MAVKRLRAVFSLAAMDDSWVGGLNYFRNLFFALADLPGASVEPTLALGQKTDAQHFQSFPKTAVIRTACLDRLHPAWVLRKSAERLFRRDIVFDAILRRNRVDAQSHVLGIRSRSSLPVTSWIADFQHMRLPEFFKPEELAHRDRVFRECIRFSDVVILGSEDARKDLEAFEPRGLAKARILRFVVKPPVAEQPPSRAELAEKYRIAGPYFHLPNQFWAHKNHIVVIEALRALKKRGETALVLATGNTKDRRQPEHFDKLMAKAREYAVEDQFRPLGLVPYSDLIGLMENSVALINPSRFEGWSTTVEESKSLGKRILLSNLPVHKEQNPPGGLFFDPGKPEELADRIVEALTDNQFDSVGLRDHARQEFPVRYQEFGRAYCKMIEEIAARK
jgi:glycosyltransferase involved in cell wall biosynthesis